MLSFNTLFSDVVLHIPTFIFAGTIFAILQAFGLEFKWKMLIGVLVAVPTSFFANGLIIPISAKVLSAYLGVLIFDKFVEWIINRRMEVKKPIDIERNRDEVEYEDE